MRRVARGAGAIALTVALAGCVTGTPETTSSGGASRSSTPIPATVQAPPSGQAGLARFYSQQVSWSECYGAYGKGVCAELTVPVDYAAPEGATMTLRVLKMPAKGGSASKGALFVNPGGPGASAVDYASAAPNIVSESVYRAYDVIGIDPRGVGGSEALNCVDAVTVDEMAAIDPTPDSAAELTAAEDLAEKFGAACQAKYPALLPHLSTADIARDMDVVRSAIGQEKLHFLGKSWGTFLGATYAGLFPERAGRLVLDGAISTTLTDVQMNLGQAEGFERATRAYVAACAEEANCPLGTSVDAGMERLRAFLASLDTTPLPVTGDARVTKLTEGWGSLGVIRVMYDSGAWSMLDDALTSAFDKGDGTDLFKLALDYVERDTKGEYESTMMQSIVAINCLDRRSPAPTAAEQAALVKEFTAKSPTWGVYLAYGSASCKNWPVPASASAAKPTAITASGSGPILVVGTTRDPATPYEWAVSLAKELENGTLLTRDGDGHTAYGMNNSCIDKAVDGYLLRDEVPADGTTC